MRVLIADDDRVCVALLKQLLSAMGHEAVSAADGAVALRLIEEFKPDVLISDWMMPNVDGLELCRSIRARSSDSYIYIILLTAREAQEDRVEGLQAGADDFMTKPPNPEELLARLAVAERILTLQGELRDKARELAARSTEMERINERLAQEATTDPLTGVFNRRYLEDALDLQLHQSYRHGRALALALVDIDRFKEYNDSFGHLAGDEAICAVARTLQSSVRCHDLVARFGGEEFAVVLPDAGPLSAWRVMERLRTIVAAQPWPLRPISISVGIANRRGGESAEELLEQADQALYAAKRGGRDRVVHRLQVVGVPPTAAAQQVVA